MDNSRKIRRLQNDIRETLGNINSTLNIEKPPVPVPIPKMESKTNLQDLDQFPSLEEIENYDAQKILEPIDPELRKELDDILSDKDEEKVDSEVQGNEEVVEGDNGELEEVHEAQEGDNRAVEEVLDEGNHGVVDDAHVLVEGEVTVESEVVQSEEVSELGEDVILEEVNHENTLNVLESQDLPNIEDHNLEPVPRENSVDILEELKVEELIPNVDMDSQIPN